MKGARGKVETRRRRKEARRRVNLHQHHFKVTVWAENEHLSRLLRRLSRQSRLSQNTMWLT